MGLSSQGSTVCFCVIWQIALIVLIIGNVYYSSDEEAATVSAPSKEDESSRVAGPVLLSHSVEGTCRVHSPDAGYHLLDEEYWCVSAEFGAVLPPWQTPLETILHLPHVPVAVDNQTDGRWAYACADSERTTATIADLRLEETSSVGREGGGACVALLVKQGGCTFAAKARYAYNNGYCAIVVIAKAGERNAAGNAFPMGAQLTSGDASPPSSVVAVAISRSPGLDLWRRIYASGPLPLALHANGTQLEQLEQALEQSVRVREVKRRLHDRQHHDGMSEKSVEDVPIGRYYSDDVTTTTTTTTRTTVFTSTNGDVVEETTTTTVKTKKDAKEKSKHRPWRAPSSKRPLAIFTQVRDEKIFLPKWIKYYTRQLESPPHRIGDDIFVLDHESSDGSTSIHFEAYDQNEGKALTADALPAALALEGGVIRVRNGGVHDHNFLRNNVQRAQRVLLRYYDWVLFAEADEFVVINATSASSDIYDVPTQPMTLLEYVRGINTYSNGTQPVAGVLTTVGWEPIQQKDEQGMKWDSSIPWLVQRNVWRKNEESCKPILASRPVRYCFGFHKICCRNRESSQHSENEFLVDEQIDSSSTSNECQEVSIADRPELLLVHLHRVDYNYTRLRHSIRAKQRWNPIDLARGYSSHQLIVDGQEFDDFYYNHSTLRQAEAIGDFLKGAF